MASKITIESVKHNTEIAKRTIVELRNELNNISAEYNNIRAEQLRAENAKLLEAVEEAKKKLVDLERKNGVKQVLLPTQNLNKINAVKSSEVPQSSPAISEPKSTSDVKENKPKKDKKPKEIKGKSGGDADNPVDARRLDLRVAKIEEVKRHPDADTLYVLKINCGEDIPRTVCSGLVKHIPIDELREKSVVLLCNLKPAKMRGIVSEAMVMCASSPDCIELLVPPNNAIPGDLIECDGFPRTPDAVMNPKRKFLKLLLQIYILMRKWRHVIKKECLGCLEKGLFYLKHLRMLL
ncbi:trna-aminoacylation cofactor arc1 family member [Holotrichia oblita]|uniref:Trna-aminoacylation cofactor arc1 family member n=1 Tax=Holotrichia oblita TaxID=644536 RepID=A0ACB9SUQ7_HOLOL|nr:trna-aminoacylation cofactor arc1 family member [Holotrichia oblita]